MRHSDQVNRTRGDDHFISEATYLAFAIIILGTAAFVSASNFVNDPPASDIWQHMAAINALLDDILAPNNPFVATDDTSRHFHPLWVTVAAIGVGLDASVWTLLSCVAFASMALLALSIFLFAKVYFESPWAPSVLLVTMLAGWSFQIQHTGYHSFGTLLYAAAYPATVLIALSFLLWTVTIRSLDDPRFGFFLTPLVALMFTTHQLGAVIGLIGAGSFVLFRKRGTLKSRVITSGAILLGLGIAPLWPYYNPYSLILSPGNSDWVGGPDFYDPAYLSVAFFPAAIGVLGLRDIHARPLAFALLVYVCCFLLGLAGIKIAGRFLMPIVLVLHIGLASLLLSKLAPVISRHVKPKAFAIPALVIVGLWSAFALQQFNAYRADERPVDIDVYQAAQELLKDLPDHKPIAAHHVAAWPVVAAGQKVLSIPWPEPGIPDLGDRQTRTQALFDPELQWDARLKLAKGFGINTLVVDVRFVPPQTLDRWSDLSASSIQIGSLRRFDLFGS